MLRAARTSFARGVRREQRLYSGPRPHGAMASASAGPGAFCLWLTGHPAAGKTTLGRLLCERLTERGLRTELLDGDEVRHGLSADLGFDRGSREAHARRVAYVAKVLVRHGIVPIVALISPYRTSRAEARRTIGRFVEVHVATPVDVCERRDVKGLYAKARRGEIRGFTGVDDPYEPPEAAEFRLTTVDETPERSAERILGELERRGLVPPRSGEGL